MKYCIYCGQQLDDHAEFCSKCGKRQSGPKPAGVQVSSTNSVSDVEMIKKYLKGASEIEWNLYGLDEIREKLIKKLDEQKGQEQKLRYSVKGSKDEIARNESTIRNAKPDEYSANHSADLVLGYDSELFMIVTFAVWAVGAVLYFFDIGPSIAIWNWFLNFVSGIKWGQLWFILIVLLGPSVLVFAFQFLMYLIKLGGAGAKNSAEKVKFDQEAARRCEERKESLRKRNRDLNQKIRDNENQISRIHNTVIPTLEKEIAGCEAEINKVEQKRTSFYSVKVVYPKYQALIPVCTMYEYFDSGRVDTLTGHTGAYNLYESELHLNLIVDRLTEISAKLDRISADQKAILSRLNSINSRINGLMNSVDQANQKYISSTAAITSQMNQLQYSTDLNNYYAKQNTMLLQQLKQIKKSDYQSHSFI